MLARFKLFSIVISLLGTLASGSVYGIILGEFTLESVFDEPLNARIELLELNGVAAEDILVEMGTNEDFDLADLERTPVMDQIQFDVDVSSASIGNLTLSTSNAINEPYLSLIINVTWPSGRLIREYTFLLDLPNFNESTSEPVSAPVQNSNNDNFRVIQQGENLWNIALEVREDSALSVQQMMLALQRANPNAFINNNINRIKAGEVLRIPSRQDILLLSQQDAVSQVSQQNQQLNINSQPLALNSNSSSEGSTGLGDELRVLTGADIDSGNALGVSIANLQNELAMSEENLDRAKIENEELNSRLADIQVEVEILQNIIAIEDERIAQLQRDLAAQAEVATEVLAVAQAQAATNDNLNATEDEAVPSVVDTSLMGTINALFQNTYALIAILVILIVLVIGVLVWRSRKAGEDSEDEFDPSLSTEEDESAEEESEVETDSEVEEELPIEEDFLETDLDEEIEVEDEIEVEEESEDELVELEPADDADAKVEAEVIEPLEEIEVDEDEEASEDLVEFEAVSSSDEIDIEVETELDADIDSEDDDIEFETSAPADELEVAESKEAETEAYDFGAATAVEPVGSTENNNDPDIDEDEEVIEFSISDSSTDSEIDASSSDKDISAAEEPETYDFGTAAPVEEPASAAPDTNEETDESIENLEFTLPDTEDSEDVVEISEDEDDIDVLDFSFDTDKEENADTETETEDAVEIDADDDFLDLEIDDSSFTDEEEIADIDDDDDILQAITGDKDESATKLDLAVAYQSMGDLNGAKEILQEVITEGNEAQVVEAKNLLEQWADS